MKKKIITFFIALVVIALDLLSKHLVIKNISLHDSISIIKNFFNLTYIQNTGAAFGSLKDSSVLLIIISIFALAFLIFLVIKDKKLTKTATVGFGFIIGGIIGNLIDRIARGYVVDFLDFKIFNYNYPVFNLADTFIVIGVFFLIFTIIWGDKSDKNKSGKTKHQD